MLLFEIMLYNLQLVYKVTNVLLLIFTDVIIQLLLLRVDNSPCNLQLVYKVTNLYLQIHYRCYYAAVLGGE